MDWQGIPFKFIDTDTVHHTYLNVSHIPEVILQTGFSWDSLISGLVAGSIPAIVAIIAMRSNSKNIQDERRHQSELANKNINMQITSASRQVWINDLREAASKYLGGVTAAMNSNNSLAYEVSVGNENSDIYNKYQDEAYRTMSELSMLDAKIILLLNPDEPESKRVIDVLYQTKTYLNTDRSTTYQIDVKDIEPFREELRKSIYAVIKKEWVKLKGVSG